MKNMLSECKKINWLDTTVKIMSAVNQENRDQMEAMASELCKEYIAKNDELANKNDMTAFMEGIRDQGEELAKRSGKMIDAVTSVNNGTEDLLKRAEELACANYILYSYQYTEILEDFLHYLMGRNRDSVCYYPEEGKTSDYLLLIAQQVSLTGKH
jgi:hypothetical protein